MKKVAILQSNYFPWKGYFDMVAAVDEFILYYDMQNTPSDWPDRNQIKTPQGAQWLTVPVQIPQSIRETEIDDPDWADTHWKAIARNYRRAPYLEEVAAAFEPFYWEHQCTHLS